MFIGPIDKGMFTIPNFMRMSSLCQYIFDFTLDFDFAVVI